MRRSRIAILVSLLVMLVPQLRPGTQDEGKGGGSPQEATKEEKKPTGAAALAWISGHWTGTIGRSNIDESWAAPFGGRLLGTSQICRGAQSFHQEFSQIHEDGKGGYVLEMRHGLANDAPYFRYPSAKVAPASITFENPDYSGERARRIVYTLGEDGRLLIEVSHEKDGELHPMRFALKRAPQK